MAEWTSDLTTAEEALAAVKGTYQVSVTGAGQIWYQREFADRIAELEALIERLRQQKFGPFQRLFSWLRPGG